MLVQITVEGLCDSSSVDVKVAGQTQIRSKVTIITLNHLDVIEGAL